MSLGLRLFVLSLWQIYFIEICWWAALSQAIDKLDRSMCYNQLVVNANSELRRRHSPPPRTQNRKYNNKWKQFGFIVIVGSIARIRNRTTTIQCSKQQQSHRHKWTSVSRCRQMTAAAASAGTASHFTAFMCICMTNLHTNARTIVCGAMAKCTYEYETRTFAYFIFLR